MTTSSIVQVKTLEPTFYTRCKPNQLKLTPLSTPSLNNLPNHLFTDEINVNKLKKDLKRWMKTY